MMMVNDGYIIIIWLVVFRPTPLKNDGVSSSVGIMTFPSEWKNHPNVPVTTNQA